ncbi:MAG: HAD hydrolase-like protein [Chloroflexota bacterium]|nr:HAD hydrolase-like protein [Chloroflexota bacterium]
MATAAPGPPLHLIFDADDTLWQSNRLFEEAIEAFLDALDHAPLGRDEARAILDEIERANAGTHGYGVAAFRHSLAVTWERVAGHPPDQESLTHLGRLADAVLNQPLELIPGVPETLRALGTRHELTMLTKGHPEEQRLKVDRSGLEPLFAHTAIVFEKDAATYRALVRHRGMDPARTWMIGNSPCSDIWPALDAGLGAVLIPHEHTWRLEMTDLPTDHPRFMVVERFARLSEHF